MVISRTCKAPNDQGQPCRAAPGRDSDFCFWHDPEREAEAAQARLLGGQRRRREVAITGAYDLGELETLEDFKRVVQTAIIDTLSLENSVARNRTLGSLVQVGMTLVQQSDFQTRLLAVESALGPRLVSREKSKRKRWGIL